MGGLALTSCNDFLDRSPISDITPEAMLSIITMTTLKTQIRLKCITKEHGTPEWYEMMRTLTIY